VSRRRELFVPQIVLDRRATNPLHRQIYRQIAAAIRSGAIHGEARLPSTRVMAKLLSVSRNTVFAAYDDLAADGLIRGERGAGMRVLGIGNGTAKHGSQVWFGLRHVIRAAGYPTRVLGFEDQDGNPLYIHH
jgi:GntR family transcriptional regulator/MocR family aminotransferase